MRAFIIRPFGVKNDINFDEVEEKLISPALERLGITGRTTIEILRQGNIRVDMFQRLLTADLVVADLSIHNANVFYELGIRHALRNKRTFLIRCGGDSYPFDLQTDRYFNYDKENPGMNLAKLVEALQQTVNSEDQDSPVFKLLPSLQEQDRSRFLAVPLDFREEVELAVESKRLGDLELLTQESQGFEWESEGLRLVGRSQFHLKAYEGARTTWELIRGLHPADLEANIVLGNTYQRLGDLIRSDLALKRALDRKDMEGKDRAESYALLGRNAKARWKGTWIQASPDQKQAQALRSPYLKESFEAYLEAFEQDLNHFYSGLNALGMLTVLSELAQSLPQVWSERFDDDQEAQRELTLLKDQIRKLSIGVELSLKADKKRRGLEKKPDVWAEISEADLSCLTSGRPSKVATAYREALVDAKDFHIDSLRSQLELYRQLGILVKNVEAALSVIPSSPADVPNKDSREGKRILLFTGHRIDAPNREKPRFPADKEEVARQKIKEAVAGEMATSGCISYGIAGGASGGDILFHEVCEELGISTQLYLALPRDQYVTESVAPAGPKWVDRFDRLHKKVPFRILSNSAELPRWLSEKPNYSLWQRNNLWILHNALADAGGENVALIALWNGEKGDAPGGTEDLVQKARERGAKTVILNTKDIFGL
jgi:hypothetical protein